MRGSHPPYQIRGEFPFIPSQDMRFLRFFVSVQDFNEPLACCFVHPRSSWTYVRRHLFHGQFTCCVSTIVSAYVIVNPVACDPSPGARTSSQTLSRRFRLSHASVPAPDRQALRLELLHQALDEVVQIHRGHSHSLKGAPRTEFDCYLGYHLIVWGL